MKKILFFYKNKSGENMPIGAVETDHYQILFCEDAGKEFFLQKQKDYPEIKDHLFALVEGEVFKVPYV